MIEPKIRGGICMNAHPAGCSKEVGLQIKKTEDVFKQEVEHDRQGPGTVLIIGSSTGYGLASRITSAFGYGAYTIGLAYEKEPSLKRTGTPGWYNTEAFEKEAESRGLAYKSFNGDAFSHEMRREVSAHLKKIGRKLDLLIYSLASPVRVDPDTGAVYKSVLKPLNKPYTAKSVDFMSGNMQEITIGPASQEEMESTVKVMGGEDWELWVKTLHEQQLLAPNVLTLAYSYIGPELTHAVYRAGTIGKAKEHLESTADTLDKLLNKEQLTADPANRANRGKKSGAYVSVNKAVVTRASAVIPVVPLYISLLFKVMKNKNLHEGCIEQIIRLFKEDLYNSQEHISVDEKGRIRIDDWEMRPDVQNEVSHLWQEVDEENVESIADLEGYREDFLRIHGFKVPGVDYNVES